MPAVVMADDFPGGADNSGNDTVSDNDLPDADSTIEGGAGDDRLDGNSGNDSVDGGDNNDAVEGGAGSDTVLGGTGNDTVVGDDIVPGDSASGATPDLVGGDDPSVDGGDDVDQVSGDGDVESAPGQESVLEGGDDTVSGGAGGDDFVRGDGAVYSDLIALLIGGNDTVDGGASNDTQVLGDGHASAGNTQSGANGTSHLIGGVDSVYGGDGNDVWVHGDGLAECYGCFSQDAILDGGDDTIVDGGDGNDVQVWGDGYTEGKLTSILNGGDDMVAGGAGDDGSVYGDGFAYNGAITLLNGGEDHVEGNDGDDRVAGDGDVRSDHAVGTATLQGAIDSVFGGDGNDDVYGEGSVTANLGAEAILNGAGDTLDGGEGHDALFGEGSVATNNGGDATISGGGDIIDGGAGDDSMVGDGRIESFGAGSNASLTGGDDRIDGGEGSDNVQADGVIENHGTDGSSSILTGGNDVIISAAGNGDGFVRNWSGTAGDATLNGGDDTINGQDLAETFYGDGQVHNAGTGESRLNGGDDTLDGAGGDDKLIGDGWIADSLLTALLTGGDDTLHGGDGNDTLWGDSGNEAIRQNVIGGDDELFGDAGDDLLIGDLDNGLISEASTGSDTLVGGTGSDYIFGDGRDYGGGAHTAHSTSARDVIYGDNVDGTGSGNDTIWGDSDVCCDAQAYVFGGEDEIHAGAGNDTIFGDGHADAGSGLEGPGTIAELHGAFDLIFGDAGNDTIYADGYVQGETETVWGGNDEVHGGAGNDVIYGEGIDFNSDPSSVTLALMIGGNDRLFGDAGNDTIFGQSGNDTLLGGDGDDTLDGGDGSDFLCGGSGKNTVKGGAGADLQCAVDDAITVTEEGGTINVSVNEELDDADAADRAGRRYEIISISGDLKAVIDKESGRLTIFEADSGGRIQYRVWLIDGSFESFGTVFVALAWTPEEEPEEEPRDEEAPALPVDPILVPVIDPLDPVDPVGPVNPVQPVAPQDGVEPVSDNLRGGDVPPAIEDPTHKSESVGEFLRGPMAPAVTAGVAGTMMVAVTGGAGISAGGLASGAGASGGSGGAAARGERQGGRGRGPRAGSARGGGSESAPTRYDGTSDRALLTATGVGIGPGDRSRTWRLFPGRRLVDRASTVLPAVFAPHSPLMARLAVDGAHLRAMFGSLWTLAPVLGAILGLVATEASGGRPIAPPLWMLIAGAVLTTIDAFAGAVAATVYITAGVITGALIDNQPPDLVHSLLVYCGISFLWTSIPLIGSAMRPFRRLGVGDFRYAWDVVADLAIASLLCAWITRSLMSAMDSFAGTETGLPAYADAVALVVLGCVAVRILIEHITTRLYPLRLQSVESLGDLPEPTLLASLSGIAIRTVLFAFIGYSFIGLSWHWWAGVALYVVPQVMSALGTKFGQVDAIQQVLPRGITAVFVLLLAAALVIYVASGRTSSDLETMRWVLMLLALPPAVLAVLESFTGDAEQETTWAREILGLGVVAGSAYLAFNGWNL